MLVLTYVSVKNPNSDFLPDLTKVAPVMNEKGLIGH